MDVEMLGQVFTPPNIVHKMKSLIKNTGKVLEPSCGNGAFSGTFKDITAIEYDKSVAPSYAKIMDFFDYSIENKFDTIIGNPPYVKYSNINDNTKGKLNLEIFDKRTNLYMFFIKKCIDHLSSHGELIFIIPRELLKATSAIKLNKYIFEKGTITDIIDLGDKPIFKGAVPNCIIFRFEKDNFSRKTSDGKSFIFNNGQLLFLKDKYSINFNDLFFVKVGAVSGADNIFTNSKGNIDIVCSSTKRTGKTKKMFYNILDDELLPFKDELINRKIKKFNEYTWFMWGRDYFKSDQFRVYVNQKTRDKKPFFTNKCTIYDGSILAIFPKFKVSDTEKLIKELNNVDWDELGFICDGRFIFSQKSLENTLLPDTFAKYLKR